MSKTNCTGLTVLDEQAQRTIEGGSPFLAVVFRRAIQMGLAYYARPKLKLSDAAKSVVAK